MRTRAVPLRTTSSSCAAVRDRSMMRLRANGPRSLMRTTVLMPLSRLVTRTIAGICNVRCAAVRSPWS